MKPKSGKDTRESPFSFKETLLFLAPLAGYSDSPFRTICKEGGADVVVTEMVNARGLTDPLSRKRQQRYIRFDNEEKPIGIQLFGSDPEYMARAARMGEKLGFDFVDINMGCPVKKVLKTGAGAKLLLNLPLASRIVARVKDEITIPLSVKIRTGWNREDRSYLSLSEALADSGADALVVHPRPVKQGMAGKADHKKTLEIRRLLPETYIIANGGIDSPLAGRRIFEMTGCNGIMVGRGALNNPFIFSEISAFLGGEIYKGDLGLGDTVIRHYIMCRDLYGEHAPLLFRKYFSWYTKFMSSASPFRQKVNSIKDPEEMLREIKRFYGTID